MQQPGMQQPGMQQPSGTMDHVTPPSGAERGTQNY
jgi:hypothetical protein